MGGARSPQEIRRSVEANRAELGLAIERLRAEIDRATDWRSQLVRYHREVLIGAGVAGFVLGGGLGALGSLVFGRRSSGD